MPSRATHADARSRSVRTIVQGLVSVALVALAAFTTDTLTPGEVVDWAAYAVGGATAVATAAAAYVHRLLTGQDLDAMPPPEEVPPPPEDEVPPGDGNNT